MWDKTMSTKQSKFCADSKRDKMHIKVARKNKLWKLFSCFGYIFYSENC